MRILHFIPEFDLALGGVVRAVIELSAALAREGHDVVILTERAEADAAAEAAGCTVAEIPAWPAGKKAVIAALSGADVVHIHSLWHPQAYRVAMSASAEGVAAGVSLHGVLDSWSLDQKKAKKAAYLALRGRRLIGACAFVHCTAESEKDQAVAALRDEQLPFSVLPYVVNEIDPPRDPALSGKATGLFGGEASDHRLLFLSRLHAKKGVFLFIDVLADLVKEGLPVRAVIAGPGSPSTVASLRRRLEELGLTHRANLAGLVTGASKLALLAVSDLLLLPTSQENFGLVLVEALACGTPVVTTSGVDIHKELSRIRGVSIVEMGPADLRGRLVEATRVALTSDIDPDVGALWAWLRPAAVTKAYEAMYLAARSARAGAPAAR